MICKRCGKEVQNDMRFCPYCGTKIENIIIEPTIIEEPKKEEKKNYSFNWDEATFTPKEGSKADFSFDWESVIDKRSSVGKTFGIEEPKKDTMFKDPEDVRRRTAELNLGKLEKETKIEEEKVEEPIKEESSFKFNTGVTVSELEKEIFGSYLNNIKEEKEVNVSEKSEVDIENNKENLFESLIVENEPIKEEKTFDLKENKDVEDVKEENKDILEELSLDSKKEEEDLEIEKTLIYTRTSLLNQNKEEEVKEDTKEEIKDEPTNDSEIAEKVDVREETFKKDTLVEKQGKFQDLLNKERERLNDVYGKTSVDLALEESKEAFLNKEEERKEIMDFTESAFNFDDNPFAAFNALKEDENKEEDEALSYIFPYVEDEKGVTLDDIVNEPVKEKEEVSVELRDVDINDTRSLTDVSNEVIDQTIIEDSKNMSLEEIYAYDEKTPKKRHIFLKILVTLLVLAVTFEAIVVIMNYFFPDNSFTEFVNGIMDKIMNFIKRFI